VKFDKQVQANPSNQSLRRGNVVSGFGSQLDVMTALRAELRNLLTANGPMTTQTSIGRVLLWIELLSKSLND
jgi:hypothetical protein